MPDHACSTPIIIVMDAVIAKVRENELLGAALDAYAPDSCNVEVGRLTRKGGYEVILRFDSDLIDAAQTVLTAK